MGLYAVRRVDLSLPALPVEFDGTTIAVLSDVHVGPLIKKADIDRIVDLTNETNPDFVVLTGDLIDGTVPMLKDHVAPLARLLAKQGVFYVTGNHEYYWGAAPWIDHIATLNIKVLQNTAFFVQRGARRLAFVGIPDQTSLHSDMDEKTDLTKALRETVADDFIILLAHKPTTFLQASQAGVNLQVSGHTHAGQFFPFSTIVRFVQPFFHGIYSIGDSRLYVSKGTGYWGIPLRTTGAGEITLLTLRVP